MRLDFTVDYHAHILPGCDHGSDSLGTSLKQVEMAKKNGLQTICATPHFYPHQESVTTFLQRRLQAFDLLQPHLTKKSPEIRLGAEVLICEGMEHLQDLRSLCLQDTNELLLEMPFYQWSQPLWDTLFRLHECDRIQLVIAHADRYPEKDIQVLIDEKIPLQLNAECLLKPLQRKRYLTWIQKGYVSWLGSDIHMLGTGYQDFAHAAKLIQKADMHKRILVEKGRDI